jgi:serine phosphatase RsbU (regulator of sigma subunit)
MLKYDETTVMKHIGFDGAVLCYNRKEQNLRYAGAQTPLFYLDPDQAEPSMEVIKGDRQSIGYRKLDEDFQFTDHLIPLKAGMRFYLTTDGYSDQLGGKQGIPLGKKRFQQALVQSASGTLAEQSDALMTLLKQHQQAQVQTDDITVLGFEVS